jgi:hypothetical protein
VSAPAGALRGLLGALRGVRGPGPVAEAPSLSEAPWGQQVATLRAARWDAERPLAPVELEAPAVYTDASALRWLVRTEVHHGRPVTTAEIFAHVLGVEAPTRRALQLLHATLLRAGAQKIGRHRLHASAASVRL